MKYIIIAHKPFSEDGCVVETYFDQFDIIQCDTEEILVKRTADIQFRNEFLGYGEAAWDITIIEGDIIFSKAMPFDRASWNPSKHYKDKLIVLSNKIKVLTNSLVEKEKQKIQEEEEAEEKKFAEKEKERKKQLYLRLKKEFE